MVLDNICMVELLQEINFGHDDRKLIFRQVGELDLFDGNGLAIVPIQGSIYGSKGTFTQAVAQLLV